MRVRRGRSSEAVLEALQRDGRVRSAQPNQRYLHTGAPDQQDERAGAAGQHHSPEGDRRDQRIAIPQYGPRKVHLPEAHQLALGRNVPIAVIDSDIDTAHPELLGAVVGSFNAVGRPDATADYHGTAVAGIIRAHGLVDSVAPKHTS